MFGLFFPMSRKAYVYVVDSVRTNQMPNLNTIYNTERKAKWAIVYQYYFISIFSYQWDIVFSVPC